MSFSFYINNVPNVSLANTLKALPLPEIVSEEGVTSEGWPNIAHLYQDNVSARPIETEFDGQNLQVRIMAHSSLNDFALGFAIVEQVASEFGSHIISEDSEDTTSGISLEDFREHYGQAWQKEQCLTYLKMLAGMVKQNPDAKITIGGTRAEFSIGSRFINDLLEDPSTFSTNFFEAFQRKNYLDREDVFIPNVTSLQSESSEQVAKFVVLGQDVVTALSSTVPYIQLSNADYSNQNPSGEPFIVRFDRFAEAAKDHLTWLDEEVAITSAFPDDVWASLTSELLPEIVTDLFEDESLLAAPPEEDDLQEVPFGFSTEQWTVVSIMPISVFVVIAGADGKIDQKELESFQSEILAGMSSDSAIFTMALIVCLGTFEELLAKILESGIEGAASLISMGYEAVEQNNGAEEAKQYGQVLYDLAKKVAESSGGGLFGFGSKIGKEEKAVLSFLASTFDLTEEELKP